jgi:hypothetical protein
VNWNRLKGKASSHGQELLLRVVSQLLPEHVPKINYRHSDLVHSSRSFMELDIFYPELKLAFEYHGKQHYTTFYRGNLEEQQKRDSEKIEACEKKNITLIVVPYWWDETAGSLAATIREQRPDLLVNIPQKRINSNRAIPPLPPAMLEELQMVNQDPTSLFMKIYPYKEKIDLKTK